MELPAIKIPQIELPFDIPVLLHPPVDHLVIALPLIVLLLELVNLVVKKRALGVTNFFLLLLTVVAAVAAYLTGSVDGKEAFPLLNEAAQTELKAHKVFGTYLMFASVVVLVFKFLSAVMKKGLVKTLYLLILVLFVAGILKQGKEGGELVYKHGVNVAQVMNLEDKIDDLKDELESSKETPKAVPAAKAEEEKAPKVEKAETKAPVEKAEAAEEKVGEEKTQTSEPENAKVSEPESAEKSEAAKEAESIELKAQEVKPEAEALTKESEEKATEIKEHVEETLHKEEAEAESKILTEKAPHAETH